MQPWKSRTTRTMTGALLALLVLASNGSSAQNGVAAALTHPDRPASDRAADAARKPAEVLAFAGLMPGMQVFELAAGGGYYTEILSRAVGSTGSVVLHHPPGLMGLAGEGIDLRIANNRLSNVRVSVSRFDALDAADNSMDMVTWILGPHELGFAPLGNSLGDPVESFREIARILKPGGVLLASDHLAAPGSGLEAGGTLHRIEERVVIDLADTAGLSILRSSDVLKNRTDPLTAGVFTPGIRGKTSQFILLFQK